MDLEFIVDLLGFLFSLFMLVLVLVGIIKKLKMSQYKSVIMPNLKGKQLKKGKGRVTNQGHYSIGDSAKRRRKVSF